jgi:hypothetical protein
MLCCDYEDNDLALLAPVTPVTAMVPPAPNIHHQNAWSHYPTTPGMITPHMMMHPTQQGMSQQGMLPPFYATQGMALQQGTMPPFFNHCARLPTAAPLLLVRPFPTPVLELLRAYPLWKRQEKQTRRERKATVVLLGQDDTLFMSRQK